MAPKYLCSMLKPYVPKTDMTLRSAEKRLIEKNRKVKIGKFGRRAYSVCAQLFWEELTDDIRKCKTVDSFKSQLKTFLFREAFEI